MLLPSALSCDPSHQNTSNRLQAALFSSPPASPPTSSQSTLGNLFTTCRALQSMLTAPATTSTQQTSTTTTPEPENIGALSHAGLPTPPMANATLPTQPLKLRLRSRRPDNNHPHHNHSSPGAGDGTPGRRRIAKRSPPRGVNKRRRADYEDMDSDMNIAGSSSERDAAEPRTPKRARIAPEIMPLGLDRSDFRRLRELEDEAVAQDDEEPSAATTAGRTGAEEGAEVEVEADGEEWSTEDDRVLVELVLEKLKLTKTDWQECARSLGKDRMSVGRRWKSLMVNGDVGLKSRSRRGKIHGTWR